ncbi:MAG: hypothetical protein AB1451_08240 [Nitrospirota bacterium]
MKRMALVIAITGIVLNAATGLAASKPVAKPTTLGVPSYPGWKVHRLDDKADASGETHLYQYQYYSDDSAKDIVGFYEKHLNTAASFMEPTHTYTITAKDGAMIQVTAPPDGVSQVDDDGQPTGRTWSSLITIIRFQSQ